MMLEQLRKETRDLHTEIEKGNLAGFIMDHSITTDQYKTLLLQNFIAYKITEEAIFPYLNNFPNTKSTQLQADLNLLNVSTELVEFFKNDFFCNSKEEAIGAAYVVEGSVLGGMMIAKELKNCEYLKDISNHHFFNGDRNNVLGWKLFCKQVNESEFPQKQIDKATQKAKETFLFFGKVFLEVKEARNSVNSEL